MDANEFERISNKILLYAFLGSILFTINMFIGNIVFSIIGFFTKRLDRIKFLTASLFSYAYILCAIYYNWTPFGDQDAAMKAAITDGYKSGLININSILALFSLILLIKELKNRRTPKCTKCGSRKGIQRCNDKYFKNKDGEQIEITFGCLDCGNIILKDTWPVDFYNERNGMTSIYDHRAYVYKVGGCKANT
jgi:hypothetical protein